MPRALLGLAALRAHLYTTTRPKSVVRSVVMLSTPSPPCIGPSPPCIGLFISLCHRLRTASSERLGMSTAILRHRWPIFSTDCRMSVSSAADHVSRCAWSVRLAQVRIAAAWMSVVLSVVLSVV